jgi:hypothetical protein
MIGERKLRHYFVERQDGGKANVISRHLPLSITEECKMRKLIIATTIFVLVGISAADARGGMRGSGMHGLMAPANPTVPPSLTPDPRLTGTAPLPPHRQPTSAASVPDAMLKPTPDEMAVDRAIGNICRGC